MIISFRENDTVDSVLCHSSSVVLTVAGTALILKARPGWKLSNPEVDTKILLGSKINRIANHRISDDSHITIVLGDNGYVSFEWTKL